MPDCQPFVDDLINYMQNNVPPPTFFNVVTATLSIHQTNNHVSFCPTYAVSFHPGNNPVFTLNSYQYFSDRVKNSNTKDAQPFNQEQKDSVALNIYTNPVKVELILQSWGNVSSVFEPLECAGNFLYSINPAGYLLAISFQKTTWQETL